MITGQDFRDSYIKAHQRGLGYLLSKLNPAGSSRTISTFDDTRLEVAHWWIVPQVRQRWNRLITGTTGTPYEPYVLDTYFRDVAPRSKTFLSVGCGGASHEFTFARSGIFKPLLGIDIAGNQIAAANRRAQREGLGDLLRFETQDFYTWDAGEARWDVVLFHSSLHHFARLPELFGKVKRALKPGGLLIVNEYVGPNRFQYSREQVAAINEALHLLPESHRGVFKTNLVKKRVNKPGRLRMYITDPSEAVEAASIRGLLRQEFTTLEEKNYGGNLLMPVLKDISHHFLKDDTETNELLNRLFAAEDHFLQHHPSDFLFGVYRR